MTNKKHTHGPWQANNGIISNGKGRVALRYLPPPTGDEEIVANLRLIATAPDMLEALEKILAGYVAQVEAGQFVGQLQPRIEWLQGIVNKAKGEQ